MSSLRPSNPDEPNDQVTNSDSAQSEAAANRESGPSSFSENAEAHSQRADTPLQPSPLSPADSVLSGASREYGTEPAAKDASAQEAEAGGNKIQFSETSFASISESELAGHPEYETGQVVTKPVQAMEPQIPPAPRRRFLYFLPTVALVCVIVWLGPMILENYQYAMTRGKVRAEYENADRILRDEPLSNVSRAYQLVAQKISPSVVSIKAFYQKTNGRFRSLQGGQGSGVVVSSDGYILTNYHVIKEVLDTESSDATIMVSLFDRSRAQATIVGYDQTCDLAVLKINRTNLIAAEWGDSEDLRVGSMVWAIGSPYGYENSVTAGIISGKNRVGQNDPTSSFDTPLQEFLQTDAAVNPGNSGGPLVNAQGQVIGINTQIFGEKFQGISFAIPSSDAEFVFEEIKKYGSVRRGYLGIQPRLLYRDDMERMNLEELKGVYVEVVHPGPGRQSGMRRGDVILRWNGVEVNHEQALFRQIGMTAPNTSVPVDIVRQGNKKTLDVRVGHRTQ